MARPEGSNLEEGGVLVGCSQGWCGECSKCPVFPLLKVGGSVGRVCRAGYSFCCLAIAR